MKRLSLVVACAACAILASCTEDKPKEPVKPAEPVKQELQPVEPAPPAAPVLPEPVAKMQAGLLAAQIKLFEVVPLKGHTMPGCNEEYRFRLYLGDPKAANVEFVNVAHFASDAEATACFEIYKAAVLKAGQAAWDRLGPMISTNKAWLNFFAEAMTDAPRREAVLVELKKIQ